MARRLVIVTAFLLLVGALLMLLGGVALAIAILDPEGVKSRLPEVAIDAAAVGGALAALGMASAALGLAHIVSAIGLARRAAWAGTSAVLLTATLAVLSLAAAVAAVVSAARAWPFVAAGIGLGMLALGYAVSGGVVLAFMRGQRPRRPTEGRPQA